MKECFEFRRHEYDKAENQEQHVIVDEAASTFFFFLEKHPLFLSQPHESSKMDTIMAENGVRQVQVQFFTKSTDIELPEEKRQLLVPTCKSPYQVTSHDV